MYIVHIEEFTQKIYETKQSDCNKNCPKWNTMKGVTRNNLMPNSSTVKQSFMIYVNGLPKIATKKQIDELWWPKSELNKKNIM